MAELAVRAGRTVAVVAALESTIAPTMALLRECADTAGSEVELNPVLCDDAWAHFEAGDLAGYLDAVQRGVDARPAGEVIVLAQASMAGLLDRPQQRVVLASPRLGVEALVAALG